MDYLLRLAPEAGVSRRVNGGHQDLQDDELPEVLRRMPWPRARAFSGGGIETATVVELLAHVADADVNDPVGGLLRQVRHDIETLSLAVAAAGGPPEKGVLSDVLTRAGQRLEVAQELERRRRLNPAGEGVP